MQRFRLANPPSILLAFCIAIAIASSAQTVSRRILDGANGANPSGTLTQGWNGNFYGTALYGGPYVDRSKHNAGYGTIFEMTPDGQVTTLYSFCSQLKGRICTDGQLPRSGLILAANGNFYGTTVQGGANNFGTFFEIMPGGQLTTLYSFCSQSCPEGLLPNGLVQAVDGKFYGTTQSGGAGGGGTIFAITPAGKLTVIHSFEDATGSVPAATLLQATNGYLYGTTASGGANDKCVGTCGTVFGVTPAGDYKVLHNFCALPNCDDGYSPEAPLIQGSDGNLYGTTVLGGANGSGTAFKLTLDGQFTTLYTFCSVINSRNCVDGYFPQAGLVQGTDGNFYGTSAIGGEQSGGNIFQLTPDGALTVLYSFCITVTSCPDGSRPSTSLTQATNGILYGVTDTGGDSKDCPYTPLGPGCGSAFATTVGLAPFVQANPGSGKLGWTIHILGNNLTGATSVTFNGTPASFAVLSGTHIKAKVPAGTTSGMIEVTTPSGTLSSLVPFRLLP
jgi:uncharacterized repeat protein (TIGR03803 family)